MKIPYKINPNIPKVRAQAVDMHRQGHSMRTVAGRYGVAPSTVFRTGEITWCGDQSAGDTLWDYIKSKRAAF